MSDRSRSARPAVASRRAVLEAIGIGAAAVAAGACDGEAPSEPLPDPVDEDPRAPEPDADWPGVAAPDPSAFPLGVASGDPVPDGAVLWGYHAGDAALELIVAVWDGAAWREDPAIPVTAADGYVHHALTGLEPDTPFAFQLVAGAAASPVGRGRTAVDPGHTGRIRFGATSCLDQEHGDFPALDQVRAVGPMDFFLWLGDTVYADGAVTLEAYRAIWADNLEEPAFQALLGSVPSVFTWDDHEVGNNWDPQTIDPDHLDTAYRAFFETVPLPASVRESRRLWRSLRFGRTLELFVLDCRGERDEAAGHYVSPEQLAWLKDGLAGSDAVWKIVANPVPITDMPPAWDVQGIDADRWEGFPGTQRDELLDHIVDNGVTGVLFVAGDLHQTTLARVEASGPRSDLLEIMAGPGGSVLNTAAWLIEDDGQFPYSDAAWSATWFECAADGTCRVVVVDEAGAVMLDATLDDRGAILAIERRHPWQEGTP